MLRARAFQLDRARAEELAAADRESSAAALAARILALKDDVRPREGVDHGVSLFAAAHYRQRLAVSHEEAERRVLAARQLLDAAREVTGSAKRDHGAIEKLIERELDARAADARRALENAPQSARALARSLLKDG